MITYLDTNVLLYAFAGPTHPKRSPARMALDQCAGDSRIVTSFLTIDEFIWALRRIIPYDEAVKAAFRVFDLPLESLPIGEKESLRALHLMQDPGLRPHLATHAAVALENHCNRILSTDSDFDIVAGLDRIGLDGR